ncbi:MAG TPA: FAD-dependent oxidoreductase [Anaerolineales bacterium]|nr:FAD-dependent oxidoreductase [Anaerolineales bacterium]
MTMLNIVIVGAGVFGATAAVELRRRGHRVQLLDPGPLPHPLAASTDISKAIRTDYGSDDDYTQMVMDSLPIWRQWNKDFRTTLYYEPGVMFLIQAPLESRPFEQASYKRAVEHGLNPVRLNPDLIRERFPAWNAERYIDGYYNPVGGFVLSGQVVTTLLKYGQSLGVELHEGQTFERFIENGSRIRGIVTRDGSHFEANLVLVAAGQWMPHILPWTKPFFRSNGMPVWWLQPPDPELFAPPRLVGFGADMTVTGYYGFPLHPEQRVVKIANHGVGREMHPESPERAVTAVETERLREFLKYTFPALADAPITHTRVCLYCDTWDGHFWIDHDPERDGLVLATGGSGHGLKFAPLFGPLIADVVERKPNRYAAKFRWRPEVRGARNEEEARYKASSPSSLLSPSG